MIGKVEGLTGDLSVGPDGGDADIGIQHDLDDSTLEALEPDADTFDHWTYETYEGDAVSRRSVD